MNVYRRSIVLTVFIFLIGVMIGFLIDSLRVSEITKGLTESEIVWEDTRLLNIYIGKLGEDQCDVAFEENLAYNDKIYNYGKEIEEKIEATTFAPDAEQQWRRYVLLQFQFWLNSIELKEKCNFDYSNVVHLSRRKELANGEKIENQLQSTILLDLKEKCGRDMMLIPLTADADLDAVDLLLRHYDIEEFPAVIIDEKYVFQGLTTLENLESYVNC